MAAKVGDGRGVLTLSALKAYTEGLSKSEGARPVLAFVEFSHYGMKDYRGKVRAIVVPEGSIQAATFTKVGEEPAHVHRELATIPNGQWPIYRFKDKDFVDFDEWDGETHKDLPELILTWDIGLRPASASADSRAFSFRLLMLCYKRRPVV